MSGQRTLQGCGRNIIEEEKDGTKSVAESQRNIEGIQAKRQTELKGDRCCCSQIVGTPKLLTPEPRLGTRMGISIAGHVQGRHPHAAAYLSNSLIYEIHP
jgi:hypothetical protein